MGRSTQRHESPRPSSEGPRAGEQSAVPASLSSASLKSMNNSDTESGEKPVREQLKKTKIDGQRPASPSDRDMSDAPDAREAAPTSVPEAAVPGTDDGQRGRLRKKRSIEDVEPDPPGEDASGADRHHHIRKRSRDIKDGHTSHSSSGSRKGSGEHTLEEADEEGAEASTSTAASSKSNGDQPPQASTPPNHADPMATDTPLKPPKAVSLASAEPITPPNEIASKDPTQKETVISPKNKRKLEEVEKTSQETSSTAMAGAEGGPDTATAKPEATTKSEETAVKKPRPTGFSDTSAASPFGALARSKSPTPQPTASSSAFASSGFGAAVKAPSGFASLGASSGSASPFGAVTSPAKPAATGFGAAAASTMAKPATGFSFGAAAASASPFAAAASSTSKPSGFGGLSSGGGFGSGLGSAFGGLPSGGGLKSFAGTSGPGIVGLSSKPAKPFGAAPDDDEAEDESGDEGSEAGIKSPKMEEEKKDKRFYEQDVETGEENEAIVFSSRAKLFHFANDEKTGGKREWKERGVGVLKLNTREEDSHKKARFVMRADGSHRVILNTPVQKQLKVGDANGDVPKGGQVLFLGVVEGREGLESYILKLKPQNAEELYDRVKEAQEDM